MTRVVLPSKEKNGAIVPDLDLLAKIDVVFSKVPKSATEGEIRTQLQRQGITEYTEQWAKIIKAAKGGGPINLNEVEIPTHAFVMFNGYGSEDETKITSSSWLDGIDGDGIERKEWARIINTVHGKDYVKADPAGPNGKFYKGVVYIAISDDYSTLAVQGKGYTKPKGDTEANLIDAQTQTK